MFKKYLSQEKHERRQLIAVPFEQSRSSLAFKAITMLGAVARAQSFGNDKAVVSDWINDLARNCQTNHHTEITSGYSGKIKP